MQFFETYLYPLKDGFGENGTHIVVFGEKKMSAPLNEFCSGLCHETLVEFSVSWPKIRFLSRVSFIERKG